MKQSNSMSNHTISLDENRNLEYPMRNEKRPVRVLETHRTGLTKQPVKEAVLAGDTIPARTPFRQARNFPLNSRRPWCVCATFCPVGAA